MYEVVLNIEEDYKLISIAPLNILNEGDYPKESIIHCEGITEIIELVINKLGLDLADYNKEEELDPVNYVQYNLDEGVWLATKLKDITILRNAPARATLFLPNTKNVYVHDNIAALINTVLK
jgi:hypothetical protein